MTTVANKPKAIEKTHAPAVLAPRLGDVVDRTAKLSDELLKSFDTSERAAIEAVGQFVITIEDALPQQVSVTAEVAKKVTESGLGMADRLVHTGYGLLREVVDSTAGSMSSYDPPKSVAA
ncbi:MAG TPA: hypothetical protein VLW51_04765 [Solirubrobacteraceae bacterium]|nr:hypothetical protein [Solirubrobacteraceae bacterium]